MIACQPQGNQKSRLFGGGIGFSGFSIRYG